MRDALSDLTPLRGEWRRRPSGEQAAELSRLGYPLAQGYYFGRPMPAAVFRETVLKATASLPDLAGTAV